MLGSDGTGKASDVRRLGGSFNFRMPGPEGMMEFHGPGGAMMLGPEMPMLREQLEPLMPKRLNNLPDKIQLRSPMRITTFVTPEVIRELAATAIRDAQFALKQLAADGVA